MEAQKSAFNRIESQGRSPTLRKIDDLDLIKPRNLNLDGKGAQVRYSGDISPEFKDLLSPILDELKAWRKGPFDFFGTEVDAEWRADLKFARLNLEDLTGKRVADVGAGNGYYLFRLLALNPELVVGLDPTDRYLLQYYLLRVLSPEKLPLGFLLERDTLLKSFRGFFDLVLCLGVFYHHPEPDALLDNLFQSLSDNGELYLETLCFRSGSINFEGIKRYAKMKNIYLIPTVQDLTEMLKNSGFTGITAVSETVVEESEQRSTPWAPGDSLPDFLHPERPEFTVEGLPRPRRIILRAVRK